MITWAAPIALDDSLVYKSKCGRWTIRRVVYTAPPAFGWTLFDGDDYRGREFTTLRTAKRAAE